MSDAEFLSFLYSERDREESLNSYRGWIWAVVGALHDKVNEIDKNVPKIRSEDEFVNILKIVGYMMSTGREMSAKNKSVNEEIQKFMEEYENRREVQGSAGVNGEV